MTIHPKFGVATALLLCLGVALAIAQTNQPAVTNGACCTSLTNPVPLSGLTGTNAPTNAPAEQRLPKLLDLGAGKCIPCKMMAPVLEQIKTNYAGTLEVEFIDVWKNPDAGKQYRIEVIPTQIFFDASGRELYRHIGFLSKDDILAKWKELGVELKAVK